MASPSYALDNTNAAINEFYLSYHCIPCTTFKHTSSAEEDGRGAACSVAKSRAGCCSMRIINYVTSDKKKTTEPPPPRGDTVCGVLLTLVQLSQYTFTLAQTENKRLLSNLTLSTVEEPSFAHSVKRIPHPTAYSTRMKGKTASRNWLAMCPLSFTETKISIFLIQATTTCSSYDTGFSYRQPTPGEVLSLLGCKEQAQRIHSLTCTDLALSFPLHRLMLLGKKEPRDSEMAANAYTDLWPVQIDTNVYYEHAHTEITGKQAGEDYTVSIHFVHAHLYPERHTYPYKSSYTSHLILAQYSSFSHQKSVLVAYIYKNLQYC